jgi:TatD DNase family protein
MELFDSHAHLESARFEADRAEVIACAMSTGVTRILTCGSDLETSAQSIALAQANPGIYAAVGIHGHRASSAVRAEVGETGEPGADPPAHEPDAFSQIADLATQPGVVAIGEIGLDYHYLLSPAQTQRLVLGHQLQLAHDLDLPVILHNRESDADLRALLEAAPPVRGVLHCFLADAEMARWALDKGLYLGVAGPITFPNVRHLAEILREAPLDRLLIETDCPYLAPQPVRGSATSRPM